jgi:RNA polymerase sigma-70 factor (ECF subfamily)
VGNEEFSDADLVARTGRGDMAALSMLVTKHRDRVVALSYRLLGDWHKAEDVAQETFLRLRKAAHNYQPQAKFTTWLYRIAYNLSVDHQRKDANSPVPVETVASGGEDESADRLAQKDELARLVRDAIRNLPERQQRVVILHRYEGLSHGEISEITGWSKSAIESLLVRAYENLRKKLMRYQDFPV